MPKLTEIVGGLRLLPTRRSRAFRAIVVSVVIVTAICVAADCYVFRAYLLPGYARVFTHQNAGILFPILSADAVASEVVARLLYMTGLVAAGGLLWRDANGAIKPQVFALAIVVAALASGAAGLPPPSSFASLVYFAVRFTLPGLFWGWLYWRHGWLAAVAAHVGSAVSLGLIMPVLLK